MVKIYLAWHPIRHHVYESEGVKDVNTLASYYFLKQQEDKIPYLLTSKRFILDSGAFSAYSIGKPIKLQSYIDFIKKHNINQYFNLDVIGNPEQTQKNQETMEKAGLNPIPVFHYGTDEKYLKPLKKYKYIALGGLVRYSTNKRKISSWLNYILPKLEEKIHLFGVTNDFILKHFKPYSCDSSAWASGGRFGTVYLFSKGRMKQIKRKIKNNTETNKKLEEWNYNQWRQYAIFMEERENAT